LAWLHAIIDYCRAKPHMLRVVVVGKENVITVEPAMISMTALIAGS